MEKMTETKSPKKKRAGKPNVKQVQQVEGIIRVWIPKFVDE